MSANQPAYPVGDWSNAAPLVDRQLRASYFFAFGFDNSGQTYQLRWNPSSKTWSTGGSYGTTVTSSTYSGLTWQAVYPSGDGDIYASEAVTGDVWRFFVNGTLRAARQATGPAASIVSTGAPGYNGLPAAQISSFDGARCFDNSENLTASRPFTCTIFGYLLQDATLYSVDLRDGSVVGQSTIGDGVSNLNGMGYNVFDGYIYGFYRPGSDTYLARMASDGTVTRVAEGGGHVIGDIDANGTLWAATSNDSPITSNNTGLNYTRYDYNRTTRGYTIGEVGNSSTAAHTGFTRCAYAFRDWSFVPGNDGYLFSVGCDFYGQRCFLQRFSTSDKICDQVARIAILPANTAGACYASGAGFLYCQMNQNGQIWKIDVRPPYNATLLSIGPITVNNDGARCVDAVDL